MNNQTPPTPPSQSAQLTAIEKETEDFLRDQGLTCVNVVAIRKAGETKVRAGGFVGYNEFVIMHFSLPAACYLEEVRPAALLALSAAVPHDDLLSAFVEPEPPPPAPWWAKPLALLALFLLPGIVLLRDQTFAEAWGYWRKELWGFR